MNDKTLLSLLESLKNGDINVEEAYDKLATLPFEDIKVALLDHHRTVRTKMPEIIYGKGKSIDELTVITKAMIDRKSNLLITKLDKIKASELLKVSNKLKYNERASLAVANINPEKNVGKVSVVCAGTSDLPVLEEVSECLELFGNNVVKVIDVGVSGIHRLFSKLDIIRSAKVIVVIAGMEGALATVVGGLVSSPVIAVPTSVGYGTNFNGITTLLSMLNSCSPNVSVVNIDNGLGGAYMASLINHMGLS